MREPTFVLMAAGMGSRFGGLKQITPVDDEGHMIIDFSLFDARRAGFKKVVFIIKHAIEEDFKARIGRRMEKYFDVQYVYQELDMLPEGYTVPEGREKPWGTGHAVSCLEGVVDGPFAVANSDDYYGESAIRAIYDFLMEERGGREHAMVGYVLRNTVTENGYVARGVCDVREGLLRGIVERTHIEKCGSEAVFTEDGEHYEPLSGDSIVSMNLWGFQYEALHEFPARFRRFLDTNTNPLKGEYFIPYVVDQFLREGKDTIRVLPTAETWYGVTYREDLQAVRDAVARMKAEGRYPQHLWE